MKNLKILNFLLCALIILASVSCEKSTNEDTGTGQISQFDSDKQLVSITVRSTVTGFNSIFSGMINDSLQRVYFCRVYTDSIRYFSDKSGYFFIEDFNGWNIAYPTNKDLVGKYLWDLKDPLGNYFIRTMCDSAKNRGQGYVEYYWNNPVSGQNEKKLSYIHAFSGINYFMGSGFYIRSSQPTLTWLESNKDATRNVTLSTAQGFGGVLKNIFTDTISQFQFIRMFVDSIRFFQNNSGYFFVVDLNGICIANAASKNLNGTSVYDFKDSKGTYFIRDMIQLAKNPGYGFEEYYWRNPSTSADEKKISYIQRIPGTNYFIGAGVYIE
jgi:signal transduction histidine kinase